MEIQILVQTLFKMAPLVEKIFNGNAFLPTLSIGEGHANTINTSYFVRQKYLSLPAHLHLQIMQIYIFLRIYEIMDQNSFSDGATGGEIIQWQIIFPFFGY